MKKKNLIIAIIGILVIAEVVFELFGNELLQKTEIVDPHKIVFGKWDATYTGYLNQNVEFPFNFYLIEQSGGPSVADRITKVFLYQSELIEVTDYTVYKGDKKGDKQLINIALKTKPLKEGEETISKLEIEFKDEVARTEYIYDIGKIKIEVLPEKHEVITPVENYTVGYPKPTQYSGNFQNQLSVPITVEEIFTNNDSLKFTEIKINDQALPKVINPGEKFTINSKVNLNNDLYHFYMVSPEIIYQVGKEHQVTFLPEAMYGFIDITDETVESIWSGRTEPSL